MADIEHSDIGTAEIHIIYNWTYADAAARAAAVGLLSGDVGKVARQLDDNSLWMLIDESPVTWKDIGTSSSSRAANPMTTAGDIIYGGASGVETRRAVGAEGTFLQVISGVPDWGAAATGGNVNAQTGTSYTILSTDARKLVTFNNGSAVAVTLPQATSAFAAPFWFLTYNRGAGAVTITPTTSTINGGATLVLAQGEGALIFSDSTNYSALKTNASGAPTGAAGGDLSGTYPNPTVAKVAGVTPAANVATFLGTPTSANLAAAVTDETGSGALVFATSPTLVTPALGTPASGNLSNCTADGTNGVGFKNIPQNSQSAAYTTVLGDAGKHILHPSTDANARTFTIDSNANVAYPVGTAITFINMTSQVVTIAITSDTMNLAGTGTTGSRSLAQYGVATAIKIGTTSWIISGTGLT